MFERSAGTARSNGNEAAAAPHVQNYIVASCWKALVSIIPLRDQRGMFAKPSRQHDGVVSSATRNARILEEAVHAVRVTEAH